MGRLMGRFPGGRRRKGSQKFAFRERERWVEKGDGQCQGLVDGGVGCEGRLT